MDTFENNEQNPQPETAFSDEIPAEEPAVIEEPIPQEPTAYQTDPTVYRGAGTGRKESPYADSPYVMQHQAPAEAPQKQPKPKKHRRGPGRKLVAALLVVALMAGSCCITVAVVNNRWENRMDQTEDAFSVQIRDLQSQIDSLNESSRNSVFGSPVADGESLTPAQVYAMNVNSVVAISATVQTGYYGQTTEGSSSGSGFILTSDGYVVTNYHVVEGASLVSVITHQGVEYSASVVGYDSTNDVAVLKVEAEDLSPVTLGSSSDLITGDMVVAIGNPLGELTSTQTVGYVSGIGREVSTDGMTTISMIQTDAAINPGNSGGPLFNMKGQVIGITTAKYSGTTTSGASIEGIGFAIPMDDVTPMIDELIDHGYVSSAFLGVMVSNVDAESAALYGLPTTGAYVVSVEDGYCAQRAGIQAKDIITDIGGYPITNMTTLTRALRNFSAGDTTTITVIRSGSELVLTITLDEKPREDTTTQSSSTMPNEGDFEEWYEYFRRFFDD